MKTVALVIASLVTGFVMGYLCSKLQPVRQPETNTQVIEQKDTTQDVNTSLNIYYIKEDSCTDFGFRACDDFGPV